VIPRPHVPLVPTLRVAVLCAVLAAVGATGLPSAHQAVAVARGLPATRHVPSPRLGRAAAAQAPLIAVALRGDIYVVPADGSAPPRRLTAYGYNSRPVLSPHGRLIAYLSLPPGALGNGGAHPSHNIWIVPVNGASDGSSGYKITPTNLGVDRGGLAWAPDGRRLAYLLGNDQGTDLVVVDDQGHNRTTVQHVNRDAIEGGSSVAWSPDSRRVAVASPPAPTVSNLPLLIAVANADGSGKRSFTVEFPPGSLGPHNQPGHGSHPDPFVLAWAPDGRHLVVQTKGSGMGLTVTGIWQVADSGGLARLLVGTPAGVRQGYDTTRGGSPLGVTTHFSFSPDGRYLLLDRTPLVPGPRHAGGFWLANADGTAGRFLNPAPLVCCALAQSVWLTDSSGLAFVSLRLLTGTGGPVRAQLYSTDLNGASCLLYGLTDPDPSKIDLARAYGCVECGR